MRRSAVLLALVVSGTLAFSVIPVQARDLSTPVPAEPQAVHMQHPTSGSSRALTPKTVTPSLWTWQNPQPDGNPLFAISCPSTTTCFAVGFSGPILKTSDGGATWTSQAAATLMNAISCASTTSCVAVGDNGVVMRTSDGGTTWSSSTINGGNFVAGVSCPTTTACFGVGAGGSILFSADGGATWVAQTSGTVNDLFSVSCPTATTCYAAGAVGTITGTTNGSTWNVVGTGGSALFSISCSGTMVCTAVGQNGTVLTTTNPTCCWSPGNIGSSVLLLTVACASFCNIGAADGKVYHSVGIGGSPASTGETGALYGLSCPSANVCFGVGDYGVIVNTTNGGSGWTQQSGIPPFAHFGINCPSATSCFAVGELGEVAFTGDSGTTWTKQSSGTSHNLRSISCPATSACFAAGDGGTILATTNGGTTWAAQTSNTVENLVGISCASSTACFAITDNALYIKTTDGATWSMPAAAVPGSAHGFDSINCPSTTTCFVTESSSPLDNVIYSTVNAGATWALSFNPANDPFAGATGSFLAIACPSTSTCYAVARDSGAIAATSDGGANWRTDNSPTTANLTGVSCPTAPTCYVSAIDGTILRTVDAGGSWEIQYGGFATSSAYTTIGCLSTTTCLALGYNGVLAKTTTAGAAWTRQRPSGTINRIGGLSCFGTGNCFAAAGGTLLSTHNGGSTWASQVLGTTDLLDSISCPTAKTCFTVGWPASIYVTTDGGITWTRQPDALYGSDNTLLGVSCPNVSYCVAVGTLGTILVTGNGTTWAAEASGTTGNLFAVSCASIGLGCVAVGAGGLVVVRAGGVWGGSSSGTTRALRGVNCPSATVCYAVGLAGTIIRTTNAGASWSAESSGTTHDLYGISCAQVTTCIAVGNFGVVLETVDGVSWIQLPNANLNALRAVAFPTPTHAWLAGFGGTILSRPSCDSATLASDKASPQSGGTKVTFTATAAGPGCSAPLYQFWTWSAAGGWQMRQAYSPNPQFVLDTTGMAPGTYTVDVWVEQSGSVLGTGNYETFGLEAWVVGGCDYATLSPNPAPTTGTVVFTARAGGPGCATPLYQFWVYSLAGGWQLQQAYSPSNTWSVNADALAAGTYSVDVWVKQQGSPLQYETWALSAIPKGACGSNATTTVTPTQTSPQPVGTTVHLSTASTCGASPSYKYYAFPGTQNTWQVLRDYSTTGTYDWNTSGYPTGTQSIVVHVVQSAPAAGTSPAPDTWGLVSYSLLGCQSVGLAASPASPQTLGTKITLSATPSSSCNAPQYQFWYYGPGGWQMVQDWSTTASFPWDTSNLAPGTYAWVVYIRQAGDANAFDSFALLSITMG